MTGIYVHIPFCKSRCIYCDFASSTLGEAWHARYLQALEREMATRSVGVSSARTIYIGGGTPSQLSPTLLVRLFDLLARHFSWDDDAEITIEANPDDVTPEWIAALRQTPVNRVSMGLQSTNDAVLRFLRRRHTAEQAAEAVRRLQDAGYRNLSLDLIYGLPGQSQEQFEQDVRRVLSLGVPHLSAYALQFESGTALWQMQQRGEVQEADEELSLQCYQRLIDLTAAAGLEHYEISNFARPGFRSRHNSSYWQGLPYLGLGAGAHSFDGKQTRRANTGDVREYVEFFSKVPNDLKVLNDPNDLKDLNSPKIFLETLSPAECYDERIMLSLRTCEGLNLTALERDFGLEARRHCERQAQPHIKAGRLTKNEETLRLTRAGLFVSDSIIVDLMN